WSLTQEQRISYTVTLADNDTIRDLLVMTPHLYRSSQAGRERAEALTTLDVTVDVWLRTFCKQ
ncbi:MAG: rRNA (guanine-N1)-methyltransferase, partial [Idiomarinaceae bacterium]|nr:rRNA (guanine-N1)-methyltransferase [Idiomarinaceae bacterium]